MRIDHLMIAGSDLAQTAHYFHDLTGIDAGPGGSHPDLGTHNQLASLEDGLYLELIAPDPAQPAASDLRRALTALTQPQLYRLVALADAQDFPALQAAYQAAGVSSQAGTFRRTTTSGETLRWQLLVPDVDNPYGIFAPFFIDWQDTPHPSQRLPAPQGALTGLQAWHPQPARILALWDALNISLPVAHAAAPLIRAQLDCPHGRIDLLSGPQPTLSQPA